MKARSCSWMTYNRIMPMKLQWQLADTEKYLGLKYIYVNKSNLLCRGPPYFKGSAKPVYGHLLLGYDRHIIQNW